ncbi:YlbF family regulator [Bacillus sp. BRMEA1]|uniref:YlbF family regulator n=1 Tax=Neobacillus endophyticus TaxID=2738405 RepID=UPI00156667D3|nr:YlbF family regulator [Neobacillus endophyticus]NRD78758.1 YlbF family regulator [Neobacillus endophyticus]
MLATLERIALLEQAESLAKMVLESDIAEQYRISLYKMKNSKESQQKIERFSRMKELYEEVQRFGQYHPDYKKVMKQVREYKREMDLDPYIADFKLAENDLQTLLDEISVLIVGAVSHNIKVPTGNPFFDTGHGSGCGSGGSCGCG